MQIGGSSFGKRIPHAQGEGPSFENAIVSSLRESDPHAIAAIMSRYTNRLVRFAFYIVGSTDTAEDIVQHVFIRLWEQRATLTPDLQLKAYLFRAVRNRALDERDSQSVRERFQAAVQNDAANIPGVTTTSNPESGILTRLDVQSALLRVSERRRIALQLRLAEEMTYAEIAEVLGVSFATSQHLVVRALADLRQQLWKTGSQEK